MAVVNDLGQHAADSRPPAEDFGRQPPQDLAAEQSVLGGMLLSKDAVTSTARPTRTSTTRSWTSTAVANRPTPSPSPPNSTAGACCAASAGHPIYTP